MGKVDWGYLEPSKRSCNNCEFNFDDVCAGHGDRIDNGEDTYGMSITEVKNMFPNGCNDWGISFEAFNEIYEKERRKQR